MADNYLERQREQYEARKAAWEKEKKLGRRKGNKTLSVRKPATPTAENVTTEKNESNQ